MKINHVSGDILPTHICLMGKRGKTGGGSKIQTKSFWKKTNKKIASFPQRKRARVRVNWKRCGKHFIH